MKSKVVEESIKIVWEFLISKEACFDNLFFKEIFNISLAEKLVSSVPISLTKETKPKERLTRPFFSSLVRSLLMVEP